MKETIYVDVSSKEFLITAIFKSYFSLKKFVSLYFFQILYNLKVKTSLMKCCLRSAAN